MSIMGNEFQLDMDRPKGIWPINFQFTWYIPHRLITNTNTSTQ